LAAQVRPRLGDRDQIRFVECSTSGIRHASTPSAAKR
jgi:hypothetical protein